MITEYTVVTGQQTQYYDISGVVLLGMSVNQAIKDGWEPVGGVSVDPIPGEYTRYYQAMIRSVEFPNE